MTIFLILITSIFSIVAFSQHSLIYKYQFNPYQILKRHQYSRLLLHAFLHANWTHLIINMLVLFSFGTVLEKYFQGCFGNNWIPYYLMLYFGAILVSPLYALIKHRNDYLYNAIGASGAVSAVVFATILFDPWNKIFFFGMIPMPGFIFGFLYLIYSWVMSKRSQDNIAHDTHFFGAIFGLLLPILIDPELLPYFIRQLTHG
ncbi:MAG: rhomboid family intramembrane serine protease [Bacteroidales bacterium]|nr:rhomboid family intramembrane serine protease [Bacteroidales bacterium]